MNVKAEKGKMPRSRGKRLGSPADCRLSFKRELGVKTRECEGAFPLRRFGGPRQSALYENKIR